MSYGQISALLGGRLSPRAVGWVNAAGGCSTDRLPDFPKGLQRSLLEGEGVTFRRNGTLDLELFRWWPPRGRRG